MMKAIVISIRIGVKNSGESAVPGEMENTLMDLSDSCLDGCRNLFGALLEMPETRLGQLCITRTGDLKNTIVS
jgi:hypothetical protein